MTWPQSLAGDVEEGPDGPGSASDGERELPTVALPTPSSGGDLVPLSHRVTLLLAIRITTMTVLLGLGWASGRFQPTQDSWVPAGYLVSTLVVSLLVVLIRHRPTALGGFGVSLMVDGVALQCAEHALGAQLGTDLALGILLASLSLLASFRTAVKVAIWQSLLIVFDAQAVQAGLLTPPVDTGDFRLAGQLTMVWLLVVIVGLATAVNERELRRRRYDAEALQRYATLLHQDDTTTRVLTRLQTFVVEELNAGRVAICRRQQDRFVLLSSAGISVEDQLAADAMPGRRRSVLLSMVSAPGIPARLIRLDPGKDPWLDRLMPGARRLLVLCLTVEGSEPTWAVFEHRPGAGMRVERRVLVTAGQMAATTMLALSRAVLYGRAQAFALTDGLTQVPNRRALDLQLERLADPATGSGYALTLVDADHFKAVNDTHGHQIGDEVLKAIAEALQAVLPPGATVARYGGEEFAVVLPGVDPMAAAETTETLRARVASITEPVPVTASFGIALATGAGASPATMIAAADSALYQAKETGRNRVCFASLVPPQRDPRRGPPAVGGRSVSGPAVRASREG